MKRIYVVGASGSGKSTIGEMLSKELGISTTDIDALHWLPGWVIRPRAEKAALVDAITAKESWILTGNFAHPKEGGSHWELADTIIWLDHSLPRLLWRVFSRSLRRIARGDEICNGNKETFKRLFGPNSIFVWVLKTYRKRKEQYTEYFSQNRDKTLIRICTRKQEKLFYASIRSKV